MIPFLSSWYLLFLVLAHVKSESNTIESICDRAIRSVEKTVPASVYTVNFFACQSGRLTWNDPYGGVQMTFKSGVPQSTPGTYKVCVSARNDGFDIFTKNKDNFKHLRIYNAENESSEVCVSSQTKQIIIYVEYAKDGSTNLNKAVFSYRSIFLRNGHGSLRLKDCKTCSKQELIKSFCNDDFAVHGNVKSVSTIGGSERRGEAVLVAKNVIRQTVRIFQRLSGSSEVLGNVNFPLYCHWKKHTKRGYLFTGKLKDGVGPVVQCRIKYKIWERLYRKNLCDSFTMKT